MSKVYCVIRRGYTIGESLLKLFNNESSADRYRILWLDEEDLPDCCAYVEEVEVHD